VQDCDNSDKAHTDIGEDQSAIGEGGQGAYGEEPENPNGVEGCEVTQLTMPSDDAAVDQLTAGNGEIKPATCVFPFIYDGIKYDTCTLHHSWNDATTGLPIAWCSTETDAAGMHVSGKFADCNGKCPTAPRCSAHCKTEWLGDGQCDSHCDNDSCGKDAGDCTHGKVGAEWLKQETLCAEDWKNMATDSASGELHTCGNRIDWLRTGAGISETKARDQVAAEYPTECGKCHSDYKRHSCPNTIELPGTLKDSLTNTPNTACVFPFTHRGVEYSSCTTADAEVDADGSPIAWCSTSTDRDGVHHTGRGKWGACDAKCDVQEPPALCSPGCQFDWLGDGVCDVLCLNDPCGNDKGDCAESSHESVSATSLCAPGCMPHWSGNAMCDHSCNVESCAFDGGDCEAASASGADAETDTETATGIDTDTGIDSSADQTHNTYFPAHWNGLIEHSMCLTNGQLVPTGWTGTCSDHTDCPGSCKCAHGYLLHDGTKCPGYIDIDTDTGTGTGTGTGTDTTPVITPYGEVESKTIGRGGGGGDTAAAAASTTATTAAATTPGQGQNLNGGGVRDNSGLGMIIGVSVGCVVLALALFGAAVHLKSSGNGGGSRKGFQKSSSSVFDSSTGFDPNADNLSLKAASSDSSGRSGNHGNMALSGGIGMFSTCSGRTMNKLDEGDLGSSLPRNGKAVAVVQTGISENASAMETDQRNTTSSISSMHHTPTNQEAAAAQTAYV
jgi:hypothetical protein